MYLGNGPDSVDMQPRKQSGQFQLKVVRKSRDGEGLRNGDRKHIGRPKQLEIALSLYACAGSGPPSSQFCT